MKKFKIIQICTTGSGEDESLYGLDVEGNLYYWGFKKITNLPPPTTAGNSYKKEYGWVLMVDELNKN